MMDTKEKKLVFNVVFGIALFAAFTGLVSLLLNTVLMSAITIRMSGYGKIYNEIHLPVVKTILICCCCLAAVSFGAVITGMFSRKRVIKKTMNIIGGIATFLMFVSMFLLFINLPWSKFAENTLDSFDFELLASSMAMILSEVLPLGVLCGIQFARLIQSKKEAFAAAPPVQTQNI